MYAEMLHALLAVLAAAALVGVVVAVYKYGSSSERLGRSVMLRAVKSGEFLVRFCSGSSDEAEYVLRITVSMAQRTYAEEQMDSLRDTVDTLVLDALGGDDNV